jgi:lipopolysaccharide/colanic/teichoic acid biosynthesis glycosyltransferase
MRRLADIVVASALLCFTLPLLAAVALAIRWEGPGPIFERQERLGPTGRRYHLLTFRTTVLRPTWAREVTAVGQFVRYTRIDALPRLINVLRGEISMIETDARSNPFFD